MKGWTAQSLAFMPLLGMLIVQGCVTYADLEGPGAFVQRPPLDLADWLNGPEAARGMIFLCEGLDSTVAAEVTAKILALDQQPAVERITLMINSQGGEVSAWRMIHNAMRMASRPVDVVNVGNCYSAASAVFASATGNRYAFANTLFMIHSPRSAFGSRDLPGHVLAFEQEMYQQVIRSRSRLPEQWFPLSYRPIFFDAKQALQYGFIDKIITELP